MLLIKQVFTNNKIGFLTHLLKAFKVTVPENMTDVPQEVKIDNLPLMATNVLPTPSRVVQKRMTAYQQELTGLHILMEGETIKSDVFTYMSESYKGIAKDTPVLHRTTNFAEYYLVFSNLKFDNGGLNMVVFPPKITYNPQFNLGIDTLVMVLLQAVGKAIGSKIGSTAMGALFGTELTPAKLQGMFDDLKDYMADEKIITLRENLSGAAAWLNSSYKNEKDAYERGKTTSITIQTITSTLDTYSQNTVTAQIKIAGHPKFNVSDEASYMKCRNLFKLYLSFTLFNLLLLNELIYWEQYQIDQGKNPDETRPRRNTMIDYIVKKLSFIQSQCDEIHGFRFRKIWQGTDDHYRWCTLYDDYRITDASDPLRLQDSQLTTTTLYGRYRKTYGGACSPYETESEADADVTKKANSYNTTMKGYWAKDVGDGLDTAVNSMNTNIMYYPDATFCDSTSNTYWFFSKDLCLSWKSKIDMKQQLLKDAFPELKTVFPELNSSSVSHRLIDTAFYIKEEKTAYFIYSNRANSTCNYFSINLTTRATAQGTFKSKWGELKKGNNKITYPIDCSVYRPGTGLYFFKEDSYWFCELNQKVAGDRDLSKWKNLPKNCNAALYGDGGYKFFKGLTNYNWKAGGSECTQKLIKENGWI